MDAAPNLAGRSVGPGMAGSADCVSTGRVYQTSQEPGRSRKIRGAGRQIWIRGTWLSSLDLQHIVPPNCRGRNMLTFGRMASPFFECPILMAVLRGKAPRPPRAAVIAP